MSDYIECPGCRRQIKRNTTKPEKYRKHRRFEGPDEYCDYGGTVVPEEDQCSESNSTASSTTASSAQPPEADAPDPAKSATPSTPSPPGRQEPEADAELSTPASAPAALPGVEEYAKSLNDLATEQSTSYRERVDAGLTPFSQPADHYEAEQPTLFSQPAGAKSEAPPVDMNDLGKELTARLKEMFYAYDNRRSADNRSAQATMGPSEMGTPCDRRLALSLMRMPPVNPGGDGWAAFVGTCIHAGLEQMFMWADAGTGRFAVEQRLEFPSKYVPKGTADLIDRTLFMLDDHKCQGRWSRNKLKSQGPSKTYRVQAHVYAKGARLRGERIDHVAIISWPRDEATLDDLYVWTEPYNPKIADDAFDRVNIIAGQVSARQAELYNIYAAENPEGPAEPANLVDIQIKARVAADFDVADDCRFCPFYLPNSRDPLKGCNGKR